MYWSGGQKVKGQGHMIMKSITVTCCWWLLWPLCCFCRRGTARRV